MNTIVDQAVVALQTLPVDQRNELARVVIDAALPTIQLNDEPMAEVQLAS